MSDELRASRDAMLALHVPITADAWANGCIYGIDCGHEDECPTHFVTVCLHCYQTAHEIEGLGAVYWPCETVRVAHAADPESVESFYRELDTEWPCTGDDQCTANGHARHRQHVGARS